MARDAHDVLAARARIHADRLRRVRVLFEGDDYVAVSKPRRMAVHDGEGERGSDLTTLVRQAYTPPLSVQLVHRLDRPTTGVVLFAKTADAHRRAVAAWDRATKVYLAVVFGRVLSPWVIDDPLADEGGVLRPATTVVTDARELVGAEPIMSYLHVHITTGRMHQIRRHLAARGHAVVLDDRYGDFRANREALVFFKAQDIGPLRKGDLLLHALELRVDEPSLTIVAPLPDWFVRLERLAL